MAPNEKAEVCTLFFFPFLSAQSYNPPKFARDIFMSSAVNLYIRYSDQNVVLDKVATLTQEENLIFNDQDGNILTSFKFALLTAASPLIALARLVRSAVFLFQGEGERARLEFVGAFATPIVAAGCLIGSLFSSLVYGITSGTISFYVNMRRTYAYFEAWINQIDLKSPHLPSYSHRVSNAPDCVGTLENRYIWTTAPCMQPVLENEQSDQGGLLDPARIQKMFPLLSVFDVQKEGEDIVIQSEYEDVDIHYVACDGACEHAKTAETCCCCYRIEMVYDRILFCEVSRGTCKSLENSGDACGIAKCGVCGVGVCCCYEKEDHQITALNTGCFGPLGCIGTGFDRIITRMA